MTWRFISSTEPVARKAHTCEWCGETIERGERHVRYVGTMDGEFQSTRMHSECWSASHDYFATVAWDDEFMPHSFRRGSMEER